MEENKSLMWGVIFAVIGLTMFGPGCQQRCPEEGETDVVPLETDRPTPVGRDYDRPIVGRDDDGPPPPPPVSGTNNPPNYPGENLFECEEILPCPYPYGVWARFPLSGGAAQWNKGHCGCYARPSGWAPDKSGLCRPQTEELWVEVPGTVSLNLSYAVCVDLTASWASHSTAAGASKTSAAVVALQ